MTLGIHACAAYELAGARRFAAADSQAIRGAGYDGVQFGQPIEHALKDEALAMGLAVCGSGRA
jgi:hypothetical protein